MNNMLVPAPWQGPALQATGEMLWLANLPSNTWCSLWRNWRQTEDLPKGHNLYVISYHLEAVDLNWVLRQCNQINAPIILLSDSKYYDFPVPQNLHCFTYLYWHKQLEQIQQWFPNQSLKDLKYKASSVCHRVTQSKLIVFTTLAEELKSDALQILGAWFEDVNFHHKEKTGNHLLDFISDIFWSKYAGKEIRIDNFDNSKNQQNITSDPWSPIYQQCALHFTNESFHYSLMENEIGKFTYPGPFLTEKTLKCLIGETGFIPVGQFETYRTLSDLGFEFNYDFDLSFDADPGNLTRLEKIVKLILALKPMSVEDIFMASRESSMRNRDHILSGKFSTVCEKVNFDVKNLILTQFNR